MADMAVMTVMSVMAVFYAVATVAVLDLSTDLSISAVFAVLVLYWRRLVQGEAVKLEEAIDDEVEIKRE